ncbi:MAG: hypothetical protein PHW22_00170 [Bacilli bacterium]|nr:hypothetical protein [Bacilli bacterium]
MSTGLKIFLSILLVAVLLGAFIGTYVWNKKTKKPDNCPKCEISCAGCMLNCASREEEVSIEKITHNLTENLHRDDAKKETEKK